MRILDGSAPLSEFVAQLKYEKSERDCEPAVSQREERCYCGCMDNPDLPSALWEILNNRLWHATGSKELAGIIADGEIRVFGDRYKGSLSKALGAVSLMDFGPTAVDFDQFDNWCGWLGHQQNSKVAIWLEIDREAVAANLYDAKATCDISANNLGKQVIPGVEACHKGPIPISAVVSCLMIDRDHNHARFEWIPMDRDTILDSVSQFERTLEPGPPKSELVKAVEAANGIAEE